MSSKRARSLALTTRAFAVPPPPPSLRPDPKGRSSHDGRGYVLYADEASAQRALRTLDGRTLFGRQLRVTRDGVGSGGGLFLPQQGMMRGNGGGAGPQGMMGGGGGGGGGDGSGEERRYQGGGAPNLRAVVESLPPAEAHAILSELRTLALREPDAARALLLQWPSLAQAIALLLASGGALRSATPAYSQAAASAALRTPLSAEEADQVALVRSVLAMGDRDVQALPWDRRQGVLQIRAAVMSPLEALYAGPPDQRKTLLDLREQLTLLLQRAGTVH